MIIKILYYYYILLAIVLFYNVSADLSTNVENQLIKCDNGSIIKIITLFDITPLNATIFESQQKRVIKTLKHLDVFLKGKKHKFALYAFHRLPVLLSSLNDQDAESAEKIIEQVEKLRLRHKYLDSSPAKALYAVSEHILSTLSDFEEKSMLNDQNHQKTIILLVHDGHNSDSIAETFKSTTKLNDINAQIFVISGINKSNMSTLINYTQNRQMIYSSKNDINKFFEALNQSINVCFKNNKRFDDTINEKSNLSPLIIKKINNNSECEQNKVDLMLLVDTNSLVFDSFINQRQLAIDLIKSFDEFLFQEKLKVGVLQFAQQKEIILSLQQQSTREEILSAIQAINFTEHNTLIGHAVQTALIHLEQNKRSDATQYFVIISDGKNREIQNHTQSTGRRLQEAKAKIFAATANTDFNMGELLLYTENEKHIYAGLNYKQFVSDVSLLINKCLKNLSEKLTDRNTSKNSTDIENEAFKTNMRKQNLFIDLSDPFQKPKKLNTIQEIINKQNLSLIKLNKMNMIKFDQTMDSDVFENDKLNFNDKKVNNTFNKAISIDNLKLKTLDEIVNRQLQSQQDLNQIPDDCLTEVVFLIDRSKPNEDYNFKKSIDFLISFVNKINEVDIASEKIKLNAISFGKTATIEFSLKNKGNKTEFIEHLKSINPIRGHTSFVKGIELLNQELAFYRRKSSRLIIIVVWSGLIGRDSVLEVNQAVKSMIALPSSETYAITLNPQNKFEQLQELSSGDKWNVYIDARINQFVEHVSQALIACTLPRSNDLKKITKTSNNFTLDTDIDEHEPQSSVERIEHLQEVAKTFQKTKSCENDLVDVAFILDSTYSSLENDKIDIELEKVITEQRREAQNILKQALLEDFNRRIRISLTTLSKNNKTSYLNARARTTISLRNSISRDDALFAIDRLNLNNFADNYNNNITLKNILKNEILQFHRANARLIFVLFTDLKLNHSINQDLLQEISNYIMNKATLQKPLIIAYSVRNKVFGFDNRMFDQHQLIKEKQNEDEYQRFILESRNIFNCKTSKVNYIDRNDTSKDVEKNLNKKKSVTLSEKSFFSDVNLPLADSVILENNSINNFLNNFQTNNTSNETLSEHQEIINSTTYSTKFFDLNEAHPTVSFLNIECKVDLIFVIDTSQSVSEEFKKQLQFAVDLVKRLPDIDFDQRVQVAAISFHKTAQIEFGFGKLHEKSLILDALLAIQHTGGSTSVVKGVNLALEEIKNKRRLDARLMLVLISDGNSQDPWEDVIDSATRLRSIEADVYAITVSHDYFFRELELYAGSKWFVYIDARIRQFLDEGEMSLVECKNPIISSITKSSKSPRLLSSFSTLTPSMNSSSTEISSLTTTTLKTEIATTTQTIVSNKTECNDDFVDLLFILDTSNSIENEFYAQKNFALDLIKILPESNFKDKIRVGLVKFNSKATLQFSINNNKTNTQNDILYEIERIEHTGGQTSLVAATEIAIEELNKRRKNARSIVVIISDGNSQDNWENVQIAAKNLLQLSNNNIYAATLSSKYYFDELKEYTGNSSHLYVDQRVSQFIQDIGKSIINCASNNLIINSTFPINKVSQTLNSLNDINNKTFDLNKTTFSIEKSHEFLSRDEQPIDGSLSNNNSIIKTSSEKCKYSKIDLILILDASTSRANVFEQQRELALSLIERLNVSNEDTHVAIGINSFTHVATLRQTLGLGRNRKMVRKAIEDIKYQGGSTLTAQAVELAIEDLKRGRRSDAIQVVVLMNDGMSQDLWERVLSTSKKLELSNAERFGVALGTEVDLRELRHYIGDENRIYRDGSTEKFIKDVLALNNTERECKKQYEVNPINIEKEGFEFKIDSCAKPQLDIVIVFDNSDNTPNKTDPKINANRYLLLDLLGSLSLDTQVKISVFTFSNEPIIIHKFTDSQDRHSIFERIESIQPVTNKPSYAKAIQKSVSYFNENHRNDARGLFLIVGDGQNTIDTNEERSAASNAIRRTKDITSHAIDSNKNVNMQTLGAYTGSFQRVYNYDRNSDFVKVLVDLANSDCVDSTLQNNEKVGHSEDENKTYSTIKETVVPEKTSQRHRDIGNIIDDEKIFDDNQKLIKKLITNNINNKLKVLVPIDSSIKTSTEIIEATKTSDNNKLTNNIFLNSLEKIVTQTNQNQSILTSTKPTLLQVTPILATRESIDTKINIQNSILNNKKLSKLVQIQTSKSNKNIFNLKNNISLTIANLRKELNLSNQNQTENQMPTNLTTIKTKNTKKIKFISSFFEQQFVISKTLEKQPFRPGCLVDLIFLIDSSGSVEKTFNRQKELAAQLLSIFRIGNNNTRVALIKFASTEKVRAFYSLNDHQNKLNILQTLNDIQLSSGITAIHSALLEAITEYSPLKGARPGVAEPLVIVITDGFGHQDVTSESNLLRRIIPQIYAVAVNHDYPVSLNELERITGDSQRVFTDEKVSELINLLRNKFKTC